MINIMRRTVMKTVIVFPVFSIIPIKSANAAIPILGIIFRILIGNGARAAVGVVAPKLMTTPFRRFLVGVAIAYGISEAEAAIVADRAEQSGAKTIAKGGVKNDVLLSLNNTLGIDVNFTGAVLELINLDNNEIEYSRKISGILLPANTSYDWTITINKFEREGRKQLRMVKQNQVLATSELFYAVL